jgi:hypothetical protein
VCRYGGFGKSPAKPTAVSAGMLKWNLLLSLLQLPLPYGYFRYRSSSLSWSLQLTRPSGTPAPLHPGSSLSRKFGGIYCFSRLAAPARLRGLHHLLVRPLRGPAGLYLFSVASAAAPANSKVPAALAVPSCSAIAAHSRPGTGGAMARGGAGTPVNGSK